jgi:hypothetical protein
MILCNLDPNISQYSCTDIAALLSPVSHRPISLVEGVHGPPVTLLFVIDIALGSLSFVISSWPHANLAGEELSPMSRWSPMSVSPPRGLLTSGLIHIGASNSSGFILILQSFATQPLNWRNVWTPSNIRIWVNPISLINSSFECSDKTGMLLVTLNIVLMISCDE